MLIDTHCHLTDKKYEGKVDNVIAAAEEAGVGIVITQGTDLKDSRAAINLAEKHRNVYACVGIYPHDEKGKPLEELEMELQKLVDSSSKVVGIGECGIDLPKGTEITPVERQLELFEMHVRLAKKNKLPLVVHNRNADEHILNVLDKHRGEDLTGVIHCFTSGEEVAKRALALSFKISFTAIVTYPSGKDLWDVVKKIPNDKMLLETDAPYLPPQGHRGEVNEPKYVKITAKTLAEIKSMPLRKLAEETSNNALNLFSRIARTENI